VHPILDLLERHNTRATFFVGELIERYPEVVRDIDASGHEIGCHTMTHTNLWDLDATSFAGELDSFRGALDSLLPGCRSIGFRAPMFSLDKRTCWALPVLKDAGYRYDSSIFPAGTGYYGMAEAPCAPIVPLDDPGKADVSAQEIPVSILPLWKLRVPVAGGAYMRLMPYALFERLLRVVARRRPIVLYAHPWEFHSDTPRVRLPLIERMALYYNIPRNITKLERLLKRFRFGPIREVFAVAPDRDVSHPSSQTSY
jgi:polysaccharide deacetylase family protein (PEP-CTERM system associated)